MFVSAFILSIALSAASFQGKSTAVEVLKVPVSPHRYSVDEILATAGINDRCTLGSKELTGNQRYDFSNYRMGSSKQIGMTINQYTGENPSIKAVVVGKSSPDIQHWDQMVMVFQPKNATPRFITCNYLKTVQKADVFRTASDSPIDVIFTIKETIVSGYLGTILQGKAKFDGREYTIGWEDINGDNQITKYTTDFIGFDYDGDGLYSRVRQAFGETRDSYELDQVNDLNEAPDGFFYKIEYDPTSSCLIFRKDPRKVGVIHIDGLIRQVRVKELAKKPLDIVARPLGGYLRLPLGTYEVSRMNIKYLRSDKRYSRVCFESLNTKDPNPIVVTSEETVQSEIGKGLRVDLEAKLEGGKLTFVMMVYDKTGLRANSAQGPDGTSLPRPSLTVYGEDGAVLLQQQFTYG